VIQIPLMNDEQQLGSSLGNLNNNNKRKILVDDEENVLFTYKTFLEFLLLIKNKKNSHV
jgi:hypothetical protein